MLSVVLLISLVACSTNGSNNNVGDSPKQNDQGKNEPKTVTPDNKKEEEPETIDPMAKYDPPITMEVGYGRVDADVVLPDGQTKDNNMWTQIYEDELGIKLEAKYAMPSGEEMNQRLNALIVSNDLPDIFTVHGSQTQQLQQLIEADLIADLTDVYDQYASPLVKDLLPEAALEPILRDGRLFAIPHMVDTSEDGFMIWIRTDWLDNLKLSPPKTMQDLLAIAKAFTHDDPDQNGQDDTYGFVASADGNVSNPFTLGGFFYGYHAYPGIWLKDDSGKLVYGSIQPEMKDALQQLQELYQDGVISKEWTVNDNAQNQQDLINGKVGIYFAKNWASEVPLQKNIDLNPDADWHAYPFVSIDNQPAKAVKGKLKVTNYFVESSDFSHPEAIIKLLNVTVENLYGSEPIQDPPGSKSLWKMTPVNAEPFGKNLRKYSNVQEALKNNDGSKLDAAAKKKYDGVVQFKEGDMSKWGTAREYDKDGSFSVLEHYIDNDLWMVNEFYGLPTETMQLKQSVLDKLMVETIIDIVNGADLSKFDSFVEQWKNQGGDEITKEVNEWYESM